MILTALPILLKDAAAGIASPFSEAFVPPTQDNLDSFRPPSPGFLQRVLPFEILIEDAEGEVLTVEVRALTRLSDAP